MPLDRSPPHASLASGNAAKNNLETSNSTDAVSPQINAVSGHMRIPPFLKTKPRLWFLQLEGILSAHNITADNSRYGQLFSCLDGDAIREVADIIASPKTGNRYQRLKDALIRCYSDTADQQMHRLLTSLELGNQKRSQLLRQMRNLSENRLTDDVLLVKWRTLLSAYLQRMLKLIKNAFR